MKDQLLIDKTVLKGCRKRRTNLAMVWIDYRRAYGFDPHSWILECLDMLGAADNVSRFFGKKHEEVETSFEFEWVGCMRG